VDGKVFFTPGHTKGSISILFGNREAIIGDVMMGGVLGGAVFGTRPNYHYFIDDRKDLHASIKKIMSWNPAKLYVGHGGPLNDNDVLNQFSKELQ
jgi:glyoxylase-like metal-dependent hydrolase (beta-lactamase superfamily II)